jgi:hypothetical protein
LLLGIKLVGLKRFLIMGYYVRVLSTAADCVPLLVLQSLLEKKKLKATLSADEGASANWTQLILSHTDGQEIASIERNLVEEGSLASEELAEFADEITDCKPANAAKWLIDYFPRVRCIYAFKVLSGVEHKNGWEILGAVKNCIWSSASSVIQADNEGFSNEDGYHIIWQFSDSVDGDWWMGVLIGGQWKHFQMDLGNRKHRESFFQGQIPDGARLAS